ncbi:FAD:protein FMN transferase [Paracoccus tegillarcae]|uniref:FAD:protein FMN transferase n=1 Tax=Paracoccus tegillarcae TaxID=1529068 RepID=A0A2K9EJD2_9RHOB|nr:FAD:protein FMN transferase [Paracoccus tegillarcae]AUH33477.1 nosX [Paracoccus tegillarcae]
MSVRLTRRRFLAISACAVAASPAQAASWQGIVMGADARITLRGNPAETEPALRAALQQLRRIEALFSLYRADSALSRLNRDGVLERPDADFTALLRLCSQVHTLTGGRFDPTVQPLWQALASGTDPAPARAAIGWDRVVIGPRAIRLGRGQALTLNGIAQGFAADAVRDTLAQHGLTQALVDMGEFAALGGPWRVGVGDPDLGVVLTRALSGNAVATSSPGAMALGPAGHILNPLDAAPPQWSTISVEADRAALADGLSTALCFADRSAFADILRRARPAATRITAIAPNGDIVTELP